MKPSPAPCRALLVSGGEESLRQMRAFLEREGHIEETSVQSGGEARRLLLGEEIDLLVINAPLPDEFGHELAVHAAEETAAGVLLLVKNDLFEEVSAGMEDAGVLVLPKPLQRQLFQQALRFALAASARLKRAQTQTVQLQTRLNELKLVSRAKCVLMETLQMSESDAHHYIEKMAMDRRLSRREVAESLLKTYEK